MKINELIATAKAAADEYRASQEKLFEPSNPQFFPVVPSDGTEELRLEYRRLALESHFFLAKTILGYSKLRADPHGEMCAFCDFLEAHPELNRSVAYSARDTYKTTIFTITRAIRRGCADPNTRGLILANTGENAVRFGTEIKNQFQFNKLLKWVFPEVIPENFNTTRWNANELQLKRDSLWRDPTYDMMGQTGNYESRHYDWIIPDDLVTEEAIHSDVKMAAITARVTGLESLLINDVEGRIDFVGSRKKKGDSYEDIEKYYGIDEETPAIPIGPHAELRGSLVVYSRSIYEDGKNIFPYSKELKSGISDVYLIRLRTHDPERYHAQYANSPKSSGLSLFNVKDLRYFTLDEKTGEIVASHGGKEIERTSVWAMQRLVLYDPALSKTKTKRTSKQAMHVVAKGSGPNRYLLESRVGHYHPDEAIRNLYELDERWSPEFISIEERGFQGWVRASLDLISELMGLPMLPVMRFPPEGSPRAAWAKEEHIKTLQPIVRNHLLWVLPGMTEIISDVESYPNIVWKDSLDALAQGTEWWPFSIDEAALAAHREAERVFLSTYAGGGEAPRALLGPGEQQEKPWSEAEFLASIDATGYGIVQVFNN